MSILGIFGRERKSLHANKLFGSQQASLAVHSNMRVLLCANGAGMVCHRLSPAHVQGLSPVRTFVQIGTYNHAHPSHDSYVVVRVQTCEDQHINNPSPYGQVPLGTCEVRCHMHTPNSYGPPGIHRSDLQLRICTKSRRRRCRKLLCILNCSFVTSFIKWLSYLA